MPKNPRPQRDRVLMPLLFLLTVFVSEARPPNIIHIMADDLGWRDVGVYGSELYETPNLDRLAERGMVFSDAYAASPLCSPTRAATLTGQTPSRIRITSPTGHLAQVILDPKEAPAGPPGYPMTNPGNRSRLPLDSVTISQVLKDAGYATALLGKWHLGHAPYIPESFGFDFVVGGRGTPGPPQSRFFGPWDPLKDNVPMVEGNPNIDDVLGDHAVDFITENRQKPFFLSFWLYNPHAPFQAKETDIEAFGAAAEAAVFQRSAIMASMVKTIDDNVGKVMEALEAQGLAENTLIIFTSDNGGNMYNRPEGENPTNNHPLRAGKGNNYEGGSRVPLIVSWPGVVQPGTLSNAISISYDWFPTFLEVAGLAKPEDWTLDGKSLLPALRGEPFERGPIYSMFPHTVLATGNVANVWIRDGDWKLLRFFHAGPKQEDILELYNLSWDAGEQDNLVHAHPGVAKRLNDLLTRQLEDEGALLPRRNPNYDPNLKQARFTMVDGAYFSGGVSDSEATIVAKSHRVTLRYDLFARAEVGDALALTIETNAVVGALAGPAEAPLFGPPVAVVPDLEPQEISIPLTRRVESGELLVILELEQPGHARITNARMMDGGVDSVRPPRKVVGLPEYQLEGNRAGGLGDWLPTKDVADVEVKQGVLKLRTSGSDPILVATSIQFEPEAVDFIEVQMRSSRPGMAEFFWSTNQWKAFSGERKLTVPVAGGDQWEALRFPVGDHSEWLGAVITRLRFDPINLGDAEVVIRSIRAGRN